MTRGGLHRRLRPVVPAREVEVGAADAGTQYPDLDVGRIAGGSGRSVARARGPRTASRVHARGQSATRDTGAVPETRARPRPGDSHRVAGAVARLRAAGERVTPARYAVRRVLDVADVSDEHLTAEQIGTRVAEAEPSVHRATVYRTLTSLVEAGVVSHVHLGGSAAVYHLEVERPSAAMAHSHAHDVQSARPPCHRRAPRRVRPDREAAARRPRLPGLHTARSPAGHGAATAPDRESGHPARTSRR